MEIELLTLTPPLTTLRRGGTKGRVAIYPPLLACRSKLFNNGRLPLPPGERRNKVVVLFVSPAPSV